MPAHILFLMRHALIGFAIAATLMATVAGFDLGGFRTLAEKSGSVVVAFPVLAAFLGLTFASIQMGAAIMLMPRGDEKGRGGGLGGRLSAWLAPPPALAFAKAPGRR